MDIESFSANYFVSWSYTSAAYDPKFIETLDKMKGYSDEELQKIAQKSATSIKIETFIKAFFLLTIVALIFWGGVESIRSVATDRSIPFGKMMAVCIGSSLLLTLGICLFAAIPFYGMHEQDRGEAKQKRALDLCAERKISVYPDQHLLQPLIKKQ